MQTHVPCRAALAAAVLAVLVTAPSSWATNSCRADVKQTFKDCNATAKEDFQAAKDACLNRDHQCVEACRADRYDCRIATGFDAAIQDCNDTLETAKETCRQNNGPGTLGRDQCIDQAQVVAFQCRDAAREAAQPQLKQCRREFVACAQACPPASPQAPAHPKQCKQDAVTAYTDARAACLEDFQVGKDACRHRDHGCVEQCRADRETCRQDPEQQLANDIAACNDTRDGAIGTCNTLYNDGNHPTELDQCIDNAQVAAFECRDQARENARPGFEACRQSFRSCVQACPVV